MHKDYKIMLGWKAIMLIILKLLIVIATCLSAYRLCQSGDYMLMITVVILCVLAIGQIDSEIELILEKDNVKLG